MSARKSEAHFAALEAHFDYRFNDRDLLAEALTHASALTAQSKAQRSYERLEFLGDRVLGLIVAEQLCVRFPDAGESGLAPRLNALVNRAACARAARRAELGPALKLSPSEAQQGGREKEQILADACEAVIAALYLDGGFEPARAFVLKFWGEAFDAVQRLPRDAKTALQEWAAAKKRTLTYELMERTGPEHAPRFAVEARVEGYAPTRGVGGSKREAERAAAAAFLAEVGADG
ncbi:MAG TPA: ribonuclease III [Caulobacterales bacterium]|nr:ribonuclease III [Caulobacterales bacterium]